MPSSAICWRVEATAVRRRFRALAAAALVRASRVALAVARLHLRLALNLAQAGLIPRRTLPAILRLAWGIDRLAGRLALRALRLARPGSRR
ncbi:MAG: hypothetical protein ACK4M6_08700 [Hyphomonas sp.]